MTNAIVLVLVSIMQFVQASSPARAVEYRMNAGDVLELVVLGVPGLRERLVIGPDGSTFFPVIGELRVSGLSLQEVRAKVQSMMRGKVFRRHSEDGRDDPVVLAPDQINVVVADYRPIYLTGDVNKPGEQSYRPGMTVHQSVAVAGGYMTIRSGMNNLVLDAIDFDRELTSLQLDFARQTAYVQRLLAEFDGRSKPDGDNARSEAEADPEMLTKIRRAELDQFRLRRDDYAKEESYLKDAATSVSDRIAKLKDQEAKEREGTSADLDQLKRDKELVQKGMVPVTRLADARRMGLLSSTSLLQTGAMLGQAIRERQDIERRLQRLPEARQMDLAHELETAQIDLVKLKSRIQAVRRKLAVTGTLRSQLADGRRVDPQVTIFRDNNGSSEQIKADEYTRLQPGDVVEVGIIARFVDGSEIGKTADQRQ